MISCWVTNCCKVVFDDCFSNVSVSWQRAQRKKPMKDSASKMLLLYLKLVCCVQRTSMFPSLVWESNNTFIWWFGFAGSFEMSFQTLSDRFCSNSALISGPMPNHMLDVQQFLSRTFPLLTAYFFIRWLFLWLFGNRQSLVILPDRIKRNKMNRNGITARCFLTCVLYSTTFFLCITRVESRWLDVAPPWVTLLCVKKRQTSLHLYSPHEVHLSSKKIGHVCGTTYLFNRYIYLKYAGFVVGIALRLFPNWHQNEKAEHRPRKPLVTSAVGSLSLCRTSGLSGGGCDLSVVPLRSHQAFTHTPPPPTSPPSQPRCPSGSPLSLLCLFSPPSP